MSAMKQRFRRWLCRVFGHPWRQVWHGIPPRHELRRGCWRCDRVEHIVDTDNICSDDLPFGRWERVPTETPDATD